MFSNWSRRTLLTTLEAVGLAGLSGCSDSTASGRGATDIVLHNEATNRRTIDVNVTESGSETPAVDTDVELEPNARHTFNNEMVMGNDYDVRIAFTDPAGDGSEYAETHEWKNADRSLHVIVHDQVVFAEQVG